MVKKIRTRVVPHTKDWERKANALARGYVTVMVCIHCGNPCLDGFCCTFCGSGDPDGRPEEREEFQKWVNSQGGELYK